MTVTGVYSGYTFGSMNGLSADQMKHLADSIEAPSGVATGVLGGRGGVTRIDLAGVGMVVLKAYYRGGLIRHMNRRTHLRIKSFRCASEFDLLTQLKSLDISVPEPIAWIVCGRIFYRAWLVTRQIPQASTLAEVAVEEPERAGRLMAEVCRQASRLIEYGVFHVDFHPGNVLVDPDDRAFIIDFDRAKTKGCRDASLLRLQYERRWRRAVIKHNLPGCLVPLFGKVEQGDFPGDA